MRQRDWKGQRLGYLEWIPGRIQAAACADGRVLHCLSLNKHTSQEPIMTVTPHICRLGTARLGYRGQAWQRVLDISSDSEDPLGQVFAPDQSLEGQYRSGEIYWASFLEQYSQGLLARYAADAWAFLELLSSAEVILCCRCRASEATTRRCHRYQLVEILSEIASDHGIDVEAIGEVRLWR
jgi:uncharacterized protein YeaO (DUF488 family)